MKGLLLSAGFVLERDFLRTAKLFLKKFFFLTKTIGEDILLIAVRLPYQRLEVSFSFRQAAESCQAAGLIEGRVHEVFWPI
jgi:hypothetical protein